MLPFLKKRDQSSNSSIVMKTREPDKTSESQENQEDTTETHAKALIAAVHSNDAKGVADAVKALSKAADSEPHVEGEHVEPHSFESQNKSR